MQIIEISQNSKIVVEDLKKTCDEFNEKSLMADYEREFLAELIMKYRPKKILEIGVDAGGSSLIILNAIKDMKDSILHSMDYLKDWRGDKKKKIGFLVDDYPDLKKKWKLYNGGMVANFLDEIGRDIDLCFIDTAHVFPGEIIDFLLVLPYLKKDAIVCIHDVNLHTHKNREKYLCNGILLSAISGEKLLPNFFVDQDIDNFVNIGAVALDKNQQDRIWDIFSLLTQKWVYLPNDNDIEVILANFEKYYSEVFVGFFKKVLAYQQRRFLEEKHVSLEEKHVSSKNSSIRFLRKFFRI